MGMHDIECLSIFFWLNGRIPGNSSVPNQRQELLSSLWIVPENSQHAASHGRATGFLQWK